MPSSSRASSQVSDTGRPAGSAHRHLHAPAAHRGGPQAIVGEHGDELVAAPAEAAVLEADRVAEHGGHLLQAAVAREVAVPVELL